MRPAHSHSLPYGFFCVWMSFTAPSSSPPSPPPSTTSSVRRRYNSTLIFLNFIYQLYEFQLSFQFISVYYDFAVDEKKASNWILSQKALVLSLFLCVSPFPQSFSKTNINKSLLQCSEIVLLVSIQNGIVLCGFSGNLSEMNLEIWCVDCGQPIIHHKQKEAKKENKYDCTVYT